MLFDHIKQNRTCFFLSFHSSRLLRAITLVAASLAATFFGDERKSAEFHPSHMQQSWDEIFFSSLYLRHHDFSQGE